MSALEFACCGFASGRPQPHTKHRVEIAIASSVATAAMRQPPGWARRMCETKHPPVQNQKRQRSLPPTARLCHRQLPSNCTTHSGLELWSLLSALASAPPPWLGKPLRRSPMYTRSMQNTGRLQRRRLSSRHGGVCRSHHPDIYACPLHEYVPKGTRLSLQPMLLFPRLKFGQDAQLVLGCVLQMTEQQLDHGCRFVRRPPSRNDYRSHDFDHIALKCLNPQMALRMSV